jgi:uncharacterized protein
MAPDCRRSIAPTMRHPTDHRMNTTTGLLAEDFDRLDQILDALRVQHDETPQWEFCEGFLAAMVCCRQTLSVDEWLPVLLGLEDGARFASEAERAEFMQLWQKREAAVRLSLDTPVEALDDDRAYDPQVLDVRGAIASLPPEEQGEIEGGDIPSFAQVWALGFMYFIESWPAQWEPPRDKETARRHDQALQAIVALTEDDTAEPVLSALGDDAPPSVSEQRLNAYGQALWAVYDLREIWRQIGPRVQQVFRSQTPARNDPCSCGSGLKFKKCCGR